ncbi:MAG: HD domain-containing protein [Nanoarchaeota archaeon]|nr:HD domain-containing protein [Nanoarchaeota archaeon]
MELTEEIIKEIRTIVRKNHDVGIHKERDYNYHISSVVKNSLLLADKLGADRKIVEAAALLHDIGRAEGIVGKFNMDNEHHLIGEKEAEKILLGLNVDVELVEKIKHCVLTHRGRKGPTPETIEAKIVACADAMSHFDTFLDIFEWFTSTVDTFEEAVNLVDAKMRRNWDKKLLPEAKEILKEKYEAITLIINSMKEYMN